jgi:hypothetical protein
MKTQSVLGWTLALPLIFGAGNARAIDTPTPVPSTWSPDGKHWYPGAAPSNSRPSNNNNNNNPQPTPPQPPQGPSQADLEAQRQQQLETAQRQRDADAAAAQAAFQTDKQQALQSLKGITPDDLQLKSIGSDNPSLALKGLDDSSAYNQLKSGNGFDSSTKSAFPANELKGLEPVAKPVSPQPFIITDAMVVDARNVPTGLPKNVEDSIPPTPAGDRVRKGFQAVLTVNWQQHDWKVALAWFQDALNHDPGNSGIKELVDLAQFTLNRRIQMHNLAFENNSTPVQSAPPAADAAKRAAEWKIAADDFYKFVIEPEEKSFDQKLVRDTELNPRQSPQKAADPAWAKFTQWLNEIFHPNPEKHPLNPQPVGAVRG